MVIGIDTNVLLRALLGDDDRQSTSARHFLSALEQERQGYVSVPVLMELFWVLRSRYRIPRGDLLTMIGDLMQVRCLVVEHSEAVSRALKLCDAGRIDFSDAVIAELHRSARCDHTVTFDEDAAKHIPAMHLLA